jgi:transcriptional regulator with XRE-family HTH domain
MASPEKIRSDRERLSALLRDLRARAGTTSHNAARAAGFSQSKLSKIENGLLMPAEDDVLALCRVYSATSAERGELIGLLRRLANENESARVILQRGAYRKQQQIGRIEANTKVFRDFQPTYVLGLLQTADYMRCVFADLPPEDVEKSVAARLARQQVLHHSAKRFNLIMTEGALRWRAGPSAVMVDQLDHIAEVSGLPNVQVGIVPWTIVTNVFPGHAFHMYDEELVIVGTLTATASIQDPKDIAAYLQQFERLRALALYGHEALAELRRIRAEYLKTA